MNQKKWQYLRTKFFDECTEKKHGVTTVNLTAYNAFEWFKKNVDLINKT